MSKIETKKKYWKKIYNNAAIIKCTCGCGENLKNKDKYGRDKKYINGHNGRKYDDRKEYIRQYIKKHKSERYEYKKKYIRSLKIKLIKLKGGKCTECKLKYDGKNGGMFQFHHKESDKKLFALGQNNLNRYSWEKVLMEVKKCILVCANCHSIKHSEEF